MDFTYSDKTKALISRLQAFMDSEVYPNEAAVRKQHASLSDRWETPPMIEELKAKAQEAGLWNLFLPESERGAGLTNLEYAPLCEMMGRVAFAPEVFNCAAPDTGNMEVIERYGTEAQKKRVAGALARGSHSLGLRHDRARGGLVGCDQHLHRDPPRRRRIRDQRSQVVDVGHHGQALQDHDRDGQERSTTLRRTLSRA